MKRLQIGRIFGYWRELPDDEIIIVAHKQDYSYLGVIECDKIKEKEMKNKVVNRMQEEF